MSKPLPAAVAEQLRAQMAIQQMKPSELARRLGVSHMYVARRMTGETALDLHDIERMARELGIPVARLLMPVLDREAAAA